MEQIEGLFAKLDRVKELAEEAVAAFEDRKSTLLHQAFTGELTAKWREEHGLSLESWEEKELSKDVDSFQYGTSKKSENTGTIAVLRMGNLQGGKIDWNNLAYSNNDEDNVKYKLNYGDVLFNRTNSPELVGKTSIYCGDYPAIFAGYLIRIHYKKNKIDGFYLNYFFNSVVAKEYFNRVKSGAVNQANINAKKLGELKYPACSPEEQKEIVRILDSLLAKEEEIRRLADVAEQVDLLKKTILAKAFRGELGTNDPSEESAMELLKEVLKSE